MFHTSSNCNKNRTARNRFVLHIPMTKDLRQSNYTWHATLYTTMTDSLHLRKHHCIKNDEVQQLLRVPALRYQRYLYQVVKRMCNCKYHWPFRFFNWWGFCQSCDQTSGPVQVPAGTRVTHFFTREESFLLCSRIAGSTSLVVSASSSVTKLII